MEETQQRYYPNKIQISQSGLKFMRTLPDELAKFQESTTPPNQGANMTSTGKMWTGSGKFKRQPVLNVHRFAMQTSSIFFKSGAKTAGNKMKRVNPDSQARKKVINYHEYWVNMQKSAEDRAMSGYAKQERQRGLQLDWKPYRVQYLKQKQRILGEWESNREDQMQRSKLKLRRIFEKKYLFRGKSKGNLTTHTLHTMEC